MSGGCDVGKGSRGAVGRWVEERGPHRDGRDWSNAKAMGTRPKIPASPIAEDHRRKVTGNKAAGNAMRAPVKERRKMARPKVSVVVAFDSSTVARSCCVLVL